MLGFVVPVKSQKFSKNWENDNFLLERTARSICNQLDQNFKLIIVHNEKPEINFEHENIVYVESTLPYLFYNEIDDFESYISKYYSQAYAEKMMDKSRKIMLGCAMAKKLGCTYLMGVDSDDLVSNKITRYINKFSKEKKAGWRIPNGYVYLEDKKFILRQKTINEINGSTHIIREDLVEIPDFSGHTFWNYSLFESHAYTMGRIRDHHHENLTDIPFKGIVYIIHNGNYSDIQAGYAKPGVKKTIKLILRGQPLSVSIRKEFCLYKLNSFQHK